MNPIRVTMWKSRHFLLAVLFFQFIFCAVTFFDVRVVRQVIGFVYLTFIPGFVIIKLLKLNKLDTAETVLFSVGLSVAFLMLVGLLTNEFCSLIGDPQPLSLTSIFITLNGFVLIGAIISFLRNKDIEPSTAEAHKLSPLSLLPICLPILSVAGALWVNITGNSSILLFMILITAVIFALSVLSKRFISPKLYTLTILSIAIALLFHQSIISNYIHGHDIHAECYISKLTQENAYWNSTAYFIETYFGKLNSMLSVAVLPTIYSNILNMDATWVLKIVFPLIFSFMPLGLYKMWRKNFGKKTALIAVFLLMSEVTFYTEMIGLARQMIAELFFVLLLLVLLSEKLDSTSTKVCFTIFSIALITSHYAISVIFLFFILAVWLYAFLIKVHCKKLTLTLVILFFVMMFSWYVYICSSASFESLLSFGDTVYRSLGDFFNPTSRGAYVMRGLGMETVESHWQLLSRVFAYATELFILVGFVASIALRKKRNLDLKYVVFSWMGMALLGMCILLPGFAAGFKMNRFYHIILFFLAPFFALGCEAFIGFLAKRKLQLYFSILVVIILVPYFLFQTGFMYEVTWSGSWSLPLSKYRMDKLRLYWGCGYVDEQDVFAAKWMSKRIDITHTQIYADRASRYKVLTSYGMIYQNYVNVLSNVTTTTTNTRTTIYLSQLNIVYGKIVGLRYVWNSSELDFLFNNTNKVYTNGGSEVYVTGGQ